MKPFRLLLALLLIGPAAAPLATSQEESAEEHTELGDKMEKMNAAWRKLRRQLADPAKNASSLELVAAIRAASAGADQLTPAMAADVPEADRAKFLAGYRASMKKFAGLLDSLETALKAGNNEEAGKALTDIANFQKEAHKSYRKPPPERK